MLISEAGIIVLDDCNEIMNSILRCISSGNESRSCWYMAPEVYEGRTELKSDVWSLGITLMELAEGQNPFDGRSPSAVLKAVIFSDPPSLSSSKWSAVFVDFVGKCLVKDVSERWSVSELMDVSVVL